VCDETVGVGIPSADGTCQYCNEANGWTIQNNDCKCDNYIDSVNKQKC
jgi:hypothetical protein